MTDLFDRYAALIEPEPNTGCWIWVGARQVPQGYGHVRWKGRTRSAHRVFFEETHGPLDPGLEPDHVGRVRPCVRPSHMDPVSHRVNVLRGTSPAARHATATVCKRGHSLADAYLYDSGRRRCRTCHLARAAGYYARRVERAS